MNHPGDHPFAAMRSGRRFILTDGAWGTQLQVRGLAPGDFPDLWNLTRPEPVHEVAAAYVAAGARVILTNTFGANRIRLAEAGAEQDVAAINREGVRLSKEAAAGRARVFASIGPSGKLLLADEITPEALQAAFAEQAAALAEAGADALVIETFSDLTEAGIAIAAAKATGLPVVASAVFDSGRDRDRTMMGATPEQVAAAFTDAGADAIGANCGQGIAGFIPVCRRLRASTRQPIWIKANAGLPELVDGKAVYSMSAADFATHIPALIEAGADFIGGCCGTTPEFIRTLESLSA